MIRVNDDYSIEVDDNNYTVVSTNQKTTIDKTGKKRVDRTVYGYYTSLGNALKAIRGLMVKEGLKGDWRSLADAVREVKRITEDFEKTIAEVEHD